MSSDPGGASGRPPWGVVLRFALGYRVPARYRAWAAEEIARPDWPLLSLPGHWAGRSVLGVSAYLAASLGFDAVSADGFHLGDVGRHFIPYLISFTSLLFLAMTRQYVRGWNGSLDRTRRLVAQVRWQLRCSREEARALLERGARARSGDIAQPQATPAHPPGDSQ